MCFLRSLPSLSAFCFALFPRKGKRCRFENYICVCTSADSVVIYIFIYIVQRNIGRAKSICRVILLSFYR